MKKERTIIRLLLCAFMITGCAGAGTGAVTEQTAVEATVEPAAVEQATVEQTAAVEATVEQAAAEQATVKQAAAVQEAYSYTEYQLERNGISLHLDCMKADNTEPENNILMMHGSTYSSHEFDIDYEDYSLVRRLAREGYAVWRLDVAGYGQSGKVEDGLVPDTAYAAEDIRAAMELIARETGQERIDLLGWSWGTDRARNRAGADRPAWLELGNYDNRAFCGQVSGASREAGVVCADFDGNRGSGDNGAFQP